MRPGAGPHVALDIVPLFETIDDLRSVGGIVASLLAVPAYRSLVDTPRRRRR